MRISDPAAQMRKAIEEQNLSELQRGMAFYWLTWRKLFGRLWWLLPLALVDWWACLSTEPDLRTWSWWIYLLAIISIVAWTEFGVNLLGLLILAPTYLRVHFLLREFKLRTDNTERQALVIEPRKGWTWMQKLVAVAIVAAAARYGGEMLGQWQNAHEPVTETTGKAASLQAFDEHLSLKIPVNFSPVADFPTEQLAREARERVQKATQRTAFFNGVEIAVIHLIPVPGVEDAGDQYYGVQSALNGGFWGYYPSQTPPKIDWGPRNEIYQSGAMSYTINIGGKPNQMTMVVIESKSGGGIWTIMAGGRGEAAILADQTARNFIFR
jgi:hypothetical protein